MFDQIIIDADFCLKLGGNDKYTFLLDVLPLLSKNIYMHTTANGEVLSPRGQLDRLIQTGVVKLVDENGLGGQARSVYDSSHKLLAQVMISPDKPRKNLGEVCSLAYAKATGIPIFVTDEAHLQSIVDSRLNTDLGGNITCFRILNVIEAIKNGGLAFKRPYAKALWRLSHQFENANDIFDREIWPLPKQSAKEQ